MKIVMAGAGSAGIATARLLSRLGFGNEEKGGNIVVFDSKGALHSGRTDISGDKREMAALNVQGFSGADLEGLKEALTGADAFISLAEPGYLWGKENIFEGMNKDSIVFLGANPKPEADPAVLKNMPNIRFIATGAFGYPQGSTFNNSYSFPAIFRALRDAPPLKNFDIKKIEETAARAISSLPLSREDLDSGRLLPPTFSEGKFNTAVFASILKEVSRGIGADIDVESVLRNIEGQHKRAYMALTENERAVLGVGVAQVTPASPESEFIHSINFRDIISYIQAQPQSQPLIIALGTNWIKGYDKKERDLQYNALNPLISSMRAYCESRGIPFIADEDDKLLSRINEINDERIKDGHPGAKVIVLAGEDTVKSDEFAPLRDDKNVVVGISKQEPATDEYIYIQPMEMLTLALKLSVGIETIPGNTPIKIVKDDKLHIYIFIPPAQPMDYEELKAIYRVQEFA
jgi:hypothetical protein